MCNGIQHGFVWDMLFKLGQLYPIDLAIKINTLFNRVA